MQTVPEVGVTVLVSRAQDESELPEIQSIIHSNGTKVIMPSGWSANSHVGGSYSTSYGDGKSIRFGEKSVANLDQAKSTVDGAYSTGRYRETSYAQGASYSYACSEQRAGTATSDSELFGPYPVPKGELLSASESFGSTYSRHHASVVSSYANIGTSYNESVTGTSESKSTVSGKSTSHATHKGDVYSMTRHEGANVESHTMVTGDSVSSSVVIGRNDSSSAHLISDNISVTGVQTSMNTVLASSSVDLTGLSARRSLTGAAAEVSVSGSHTSVQLMAQNNSVQMVGENNVIELLGPGIHVSEKATQVKAETRDLNVTIIVAMQIYL
jgi:type VI secretion system secreted protein VgrG